MTETTAPPRPVPPPIPEAAQLPPVLVELRRWVAWVYDWRGAPDWAKQPFSPATGKWKGWQTAITTFDEAVKGAAQFHGSGVGFKPEPNDPYIFVDFDDCLKDGVLDPVVAMWIGELGGYSEVTPSGGGMRVIVKGRLPRTVTNTKLPGSHTASVELYDGNSGRYLTMTGKHLGAPHFEIPESQDAIDRILKTIGFDAKRVPHATAEDNDRPTTLEQICAVYEKHLEKFRGMKLATDSQNDQLNICALIAARGFLAGAFEQTEEQLRSELRAIAASSGHCPGVDRTLDSGWEAGIAKGAFILQEDVAKAALEYLDELLADERAILPSLKELADRCIEVDAEDLATRKKALAKRMKVTIPDFDAAIKAARKRASGDPKKTDPANLTVENVKSIVESLLDHDPDEAAKKAAEAVIWDYTRTHSKVFCCNNQGYFLMNDGNGVAIDVGTDSHEFDKLLIGFGVHPGSPSHDRIGAFLENKCYHEGIKTETRLSFHFDKKTFTSYAAVQRGKLLKISRMGIEEVPNGHDDVLFVFPDNWQPLLTKPLNEINGVTGMDTPSSGIPVCGPEKTIIGSRCEKRSLCVHALFVDGFLARHLFGGSSFEIRSMDEKQIRILVMAYILFLMMPGVVPERALLESLGPSSSGKTFLLKLIGRTLVGSSFAVRPLPQDIRELETQIIGDFFIAYDNVSTIPQDIRDRFAQAVTGVEVIRRVLFTDKRQLREMSKATISLSAIKAPLPDLEHGNRAIAINFEERPEGTFVSEEELFKVLDSKRDNIILNFLHRMILVLEALHAQKDYVPKVSVRLAGIATFILRIARHEKWEDQAKKLLEAWSKDQTESSAQEDDISIAIAKWMAGKDWKPNVELTIMMLNEDLCAAMGFADKKDLSNRKELSWHGKHLILFNKIAYNLKVYQKRFGMERGKSTLRTSRGTYTYRFNPSPELLEAIRADAKYEKDREPQIDLPGVA